MSLDSQENKRMPRLQDDLGGSFLPDRNANCTANSTGSAHIPSGDPEIAGQRRVMKILTTSRLPSGDPEIAGQRRVQQPHRARRRSSGDPEIAGQRQEGQLVHVRRYTFKLYPNKAQEAALQRQAALLAMLWNAALEQRETQWRHECQRKPRGERKGLTFYDQCAAIKHIRADDPEFAAMSSLSPARCLNALDEAFKAFFKRAKGGAGKSSGYPQFKSPYAIENKHSDLTLWHGARAVKQAPLKGCGWDFAPAGKHWSLYSKGVPGRIKARGRFPAQPLDYRTCEIMRRGGVWQLSIVAVMGTRRVAGCHTATIDFDLIDEFATVKIDANGECLPGWEAEVSPADEQISPGNHGVNATSGSDASKSRANGRARRTRTILSTGSDASKSRANGRARNATKAGGHGSDASKLGADGRSALAPDAIQSDGDTRFKRGSYRWRQNRKRIARRKAKKARQRKEALHLWTTRIMREVSELTVVCPPIKESTKSARGNEKYHGAAVKTVAMLNRHVLGQAPAMAIQMLEYKAEEASIPFARITPDEHALAVGRDLPAATKAARKARRELRKEEA